MRNFDYSFLNNGLLPANLVNLTTVEAVLGVMVKTGSVKRIGAGRATRYIKA